MFQAGGVARGNQGTNVKTKKRNKAGLRGLIRDVGGQGMVEFLMVIPVFLVLFFGIFEFSRYWYTRAQIRGAVAEATRFAATGNQVTDPDTGDPLSRALSVESIILADVGRFGVTGSDITLNPSDGGGPEEIVTVTLDYEYPVGVPIMERVLGTGILDFTVSTSLRNEPFFQ